MAQQDIRYYLNGMLLVVDGRARDGGRDRRPPAGVLPDRRSSGEFHAPGSDHAAQDDARAAAPARRQRRAGARSTSPPTRSSSRFANIELVSKLVEGKFPDLQPRDPEGHKNDVRDRPRRTAALAAARRDPDERQVQGRALRDRAGPAEDHARTNTEQEEAEEELEIDYGGDSVDIGFNITYLLDVLANLKMRQRSSRASATPTRARWSRFPSATTSSTSSCRCASDACQYRDHAKGRSAASGVL